MLMNGALVVGTAVAGTSQEENVNGGNAREKTAVALRILEPP